MQTRNRLFVAVLVLTLLGASLLAGGCSQEKDYTNESIPTGTKNSRVPVASPGGGGGAGAASAPSAANQPMAAPQ